MRTTYLHVAALVALVLVSAAACERNGAGSAASPPGDKLRFEGDKGRLVLEEEAKELPPSWPTDLPVSPDAKIKSSVVSRSKDGSKMVMVIFETDRSVKSVNRRLRRGLAQAKWVESGVATVKQATIITATKGGRAVSISVSRDGDGRGTIISTSITSKKASDKEDKG